MKTTSIHTWYKKVNDLIVKNIEKMNINGFTIDVSYTNISESNKSVTVSVFNHEKGYRIVHTCSITNYLEENRNKNSFEDFKNFLENIEKFF